MTWKTPQYMANPDLSVAAEDDRLIIETLFSEGILNRNAGQGLVQQRPEGAAMSVYVAPLDCVIKGDDVTGQGSYLARMNVGEAYTIPPASTTNPRIDLLVAEIVDSQYRTPTTARPEGAHLYLVAGTAAASPTVPALPATAIPLAQIAVAANATSITTANITDLRGQAGAAALQIGTQFQLLTTTQRDAITNPYVGQSIFNTTTGRNETYLGSGIGWQPAGRVDLQVFTASGTWTKPVGARQVLIDVIGPGGGGGSGKVVAGGGSGGSGGGGGARLRATITAAELDATVPVTVGAGGTGPSAASTSGGNGGTSSFGVFAAGGGKGGNPGVGNDSSNLQRILGGEGGSVPPTASAARLPAGGIGSYGALTTEPVTAVVAAYLTTAEFGGGGGGGVEIPTGSSNLFLSSPGGSGWGGGGGAPASTASGRTLVSTANWTRAAGSGLASLTGAGGNTDGSQPGTPGTLSTTGGVGGGGGGGISNSSGAGTAGGAGGVPAGGGGGGGNGSTTHGAGGAGGRGEVRVLTLVI
ncbi:hypothetical protein ACFFKU_06830 [Kineococcus gynurae]|uniref:Minor tail protein n=1 Tax=Kineococcus gynurae TaxID=452979 RepID=A0ABV5LWY1_9ACTN